MTFPSLSRSTRRETIFSTTMPWACRPLRSIGKPARRGYFGTGAVSFDHSSAPSTSVCRMVGVERFCRLEIEERIELVGCSTGRSAGFAPFSSCRHRLRRAGHSRESPAHTTSTDRTDHLCNKGRCGQSLCLRRGANIQPQTEQQQSGS
jgi:hypothetical protein